jgi:hypothetical protein
MVRGTAPHREHQRKPSWARSLGPLLSFAARAANDNATAEHCLAPIHLEGGCAISAGLGDRSSSIFRPGSQGLNCLISPSRRIPSHPRSHPA